MKKMNNKGFAISTLIYGLAIMGIMIVTILMATMAQTRANTRNLVKSIEEDLNRFSKTETAFKPLGSDIASQQYIVPASGWYKIELWGAQGAGNGGKGAYTGGIIELTEGDILYFYVGKQKSSGGGYASEVRAIGGTYTDFNSYESTIMVAAGGGSTSTASGGTLYGYNDKMNSYGGFIKSQGTNRDFSLLPISAAGNNTNGTLVGFDKNYAVSNATNPAVGVTVPSPVGTNGGGDGYFPSNNASTGGTSFIAGYAGSYGIKKGKTTTNAKVDYHEHTYKEEETVGTHSYIDAISGEYYFNDGVMIPGVNVGDGYARIERVKPRTESSTELTRKNTKLNNVRYIRSCTDESAWNKIIVTIKGVSKEISNTSGRCGIADLGSIMAIDEIAVFHSNSGVDYKNDTVEVSENGSTWKYVKNIGNGTTYSETETVNGYRVSAYQYDRTASLPTKGNYIIQPVLSENKVLSASETSETNANPISLDYYKGEKRQKWTIELITDKRINPNYVPGNPSTYEYKISELARFKTLAITQDENIVGNTLSAIDKFNDKARNEPQIWKITPVGNGTYTIKTVSPEATPTANTGYIIAQTNSTVSDAYNQIIIGKNNDDTARFKLIEIDYSSN